MEYKINKEDYEKMLSKFYSHKVKWLLILAFMAIVFGTYCLFVGIFSDKGAFKYMGGGYGCFVLFLYVYIAGGKTYKKQSLNAIRFNDNNEIECYMEQQDNSIKLYDLTNDNHSTIKIEDITGIKTFNDKEYSFIVCGQRVFIVKNNEVMDNLKQQLEKNKKIKIGRK